MTANGKTVLLNKSGAVRIPAELLPSDSKNLSFLVSGDPGKRTIELTPAARNGKNPQMRKALFSNGGARSPLVSIKKVMSALGIAAPKQSTSYPVKVKKNGTIVVQL